MKTCTKCKKEKPFAQFCKNKSIKDGYNHWCRECTKEYRNKPGVKAREKEISKIYYQKNMTRIKERDRIYRREHNQLPEVKARSKEWRRSYNNRPEVKARKNKLKKIRYQLSENKDYYRIYNKEYSENPKNKERRNRLLRDKLKMDIRFCLDSRMTKNIRVSLKGNKAGRKWEDLVGYTVRDLKKHLEKRFKDGLTWEKFLKEGYHIDHIKPKSLFKYENTEDKEFKECWSLENLQPLEAIENIKKGINY